MSESKKEKVKCGAAFTSADKITGGGSDGGGLGLGFDGGLFICIIFTCSSSTQSKQIISVVIVVVAVEISAEIKI